MNISGRSINPLFLFLFFPVFFSQGQDIDYARKMIEKLSSPKLHGRGYYKNGDGKAARLIAREFSGSGLEKFGDDYYQPYSFNINIIKDVSLLLDGVPLRPGTDFLVSSSSPDVSGTFPVFFDLEYGSGPEDTVPGNPPSEKCFVVTGADFRSVEKSFPYDASGAIVLREPEENMWWHVSNACHVNERCNLVIRSDKVSRDLSSVTLSVKSSFVEDYRTQNVAGYIPGATTPDSFIVFTAHYDHLGQMGKETCFFGANDNASGTAMVLDLARHFSANRAKFSIAFFAFSGEEAGLKGSSYLADNPVLPLEKIRMLINLDMVGTGSQGITVVNGTVFEREFALMQKLNDENHYLEEVRARGESCNSDHCPFYVKGVPSVFIYTRGEEFKEYHNVDDRPEKLPLTEYEDLFKLLVDFTNALAQCQSSM